MKLGTPPLANIYLRRLQPSRQLREKRMVEKLSGRKCWEYIQVPWYLLGARARHFLVVKQHFDKCRPVLHVRTPLLLRSTN